MRFIGHDIIALSPNSTCDRRSTSTKHYWILFSIVTMIVQPVGCNTISSCEGRI
jgi:hypothetical protein